MPVISHKQQAVLAERSQRQSWRLAPLGTLAIALAMGAHIVTSQRIYAIWGALMFLVAAMLFIFPPFGAGGHNVGSSSDATGEDHAAYIPLVSRKAWRWAFLITGAILSGVAYEAFGGNRLDRGLWPWLIGLVYLLVALVERPQPGWQQRIKAQVAEVDWRWTALVFAITGVAAFFRLHHLDAIPAEMTSDHAEKLLDVYDVLNGHRAIFFPRNTGREALQFYLTAALIRWTPLGIGHLALKLGTAAFGIVTVPWTYLLGRELFGKRAGAIAAFLLAISHWHVTISRVGLRFPFAAAFATPALYYLLRAIRRNRRNDWLAAGAFLGAGLHTYTAMRIVPFLFILLVAGKLVTGITRRLMAHWTAKSDGMAESVSLTKPFWVNALAGGALALAVFLPLFRYMLEHPDSFWYRAVSRVHGATMGLDDMLGLFWSNTRNALLMFNFRGDTVPMNTVPEAAVLGPVTGGLFVLGLCWVLWRLVRHREDRAGYVLLSFFVLLLPSIMSFAFPGENPSVVRTGGAAPIVMIIAALPVTLVLDAMRQAPARSVSLVMALFLLLLLGSALAFNYDWYFRRYDTNIRRSLWNATEMGQALQTFKESGGMLRNAYHVAYPHWVDTRNIAINAGDIRWQNVVTDLSQIADHAQQPGRKLYLVFPAHAAALEVLAEVYPDGEARLQLSDRPGKSFYVFEAPAPR